MPKKHLHALLVGINNYHPASVNVNNLGGSLSDILSIDAYLRKRFKNHPDFEPVKPKMLIDDEATREGVINAFRSIVSKAKPQDTFYFHYSGHGSREAAPPEFVNAFGEAKNETLVLYDSRAPGGMDLADKEIAALLSEVPVGVHTVVTFDCCHAGSGTRDIGDMGETRTRQSSDATQNRSLDSYIGPYVAQHDAGKKLEIPQSNHLMLAACKDSEKALEIKDSGLFTQTLIKSLESNTNDQSYAGIYSRLNSIVKNTTVNQHPQFEYYGTVNPLANFLEGTVSSYSSLTNVEFKQGKWSIGFGAINGLRHKDIKNLTFPIFDGMYSKNVISYGKITHLGLQNCQVEIVGDSISPNPHKDFYAGVGSFPLCVYVQDQAENPELVKAIEGGWMSKILVVNNKEEAEYEVRTENGHYSIYSIDPENLLFGLNEQGISQASYIFQVLNDIGKWERMLTLENPVTDFSNQSIELSLHINGSENPFQEELWVNEFVKEQGNTPFVVKAKNNSTRHLYFNLLYLSPEKGIHLVNKDTSQRTTGPGEDKELFAAAAGIAYENVDQIENHLILVASTEPLENHFFSQMGIPSDQFGKINQWDPSMHGLTRNLFPTEPKTDWTTRMITIKVIRPGGNVGQSRAVINQLSVEAHSGFEAKLSLLDVQTSTRSIGAAPPVHKAIEDIPNASLLSLKGDNHPPSTLEISGFDDTSALKDDPLKIKIPTPKQEDEFVLPFTFDGEFFLPVGVPQGGDDDGTQTFDIHHLPEEKQKTRSLGKALKLYFLKATLGKTVNQLRRVIYKDDGEIERTEEGLENAIANANNILLVVHGIIGDTEELAKSVRYTLSEGIYDLILTYDYENLSTSIKVTGQKLKATLVGLGLDHKGIDIMAHSMGGLVSRWMIEKENGDSFVNRLIMLGTPNAGSPFSKLAPAIPALIALAANFQSPFLAPLVYLMHWMNDSRQVNKTLAQMDADSDILNELNAQDPPKTPYIIIGGNVRNYKGAESGSIASLMERLTIGVGNLANWKKDHDVAVELASIFHLPESERVKHIEVGSHHLIYFTHEDSVAELKQVL